MIMNTYEEKYLIILWRMVNNIIFYGNVCGFNAASFDVNPIVFGRDLLQSIDDIFVKFKFNEYILTHFFHKEKSK